MHFGWSMSGNIERYYPAGPLAGVRTRARFGSSKSWEQKRIIVPPDCTRDTSLKGSEGKFRPFGSIKIETCFATLLQLAILLHASYLCCMILVLSLLCVTTIKIIKIFKLSHHCSQHIGFLCAHYAEHHVPRTTSFWLLLQEKEDGAA